MINKAYKILSLLNIINEIESKGNYNKEIMIKLYSQVIMETSTLCTQQKN